MDVHLRHHLELGVRGARADRRRREKAARAVFLQRAEIRHGVLGKRHALQMVDVEERLELQEDDVRRHLRRFRLRPEHVLGDRVDPAGRVILRPVDADVDEAARERVNKTVPLGERDDVRIRVARKAGGERQLGQERDREQQNADRHNAAARLHRAFRRAPVQKREAGNEQQHGCDEQDEHRHAHVDPDKRPVELQNRKVDRRERRDAVAQHIHVRDAEARPHRADQHGPEPLPLREHAQRKAEREDQHIHKKGDRPRRKIRPEGGKALPVQKLDHDIEQQRTEQAAEDRPVIPDKRAKPLDTPHPLFP